MFLGVMLLLRCLVFSMVFADLLLDGVGLGLWVFLALCYVLMWAVPGIFWMLSLFDWWLVFVMFVVVIWSVWV